MGAGRVMMAARVACVVAVALAMFAASGGEAKATAIVGMGYQLYDSEETVAANDVPFAWDDISVTGTIIVQGDDSFVNIPLPFPFTFAATPQFAVNVCSNGFINFGAGSANLGNIGIPNVGAPNSMIAGFWDDLLPTVQGMNRQQMLGVAPNRRFVISWINTPRFGDAGSTVTFQITLFEGSGGNAIKMQYQATNGANGAGQSATVGIEDAAGAAGIQYLLNGQPNAGLPDGPTSNMLYPNLAIGYFPVGSTPPWAPAPPPPGGGGGGGGGGEPITITDVDSDEKSRSHSACGAEAGLSFFGLAGAFVLVACFAAGFARKGGLN